MSYRGFKRLLGESSLERKSRLMLGTITLLLITGSFWIYARMNVGLAYEATTNAGRLLTAQVLYNYHVFDEKAKTALADFEHDVDGKFLNTALYGYKYSLIKLNSKNVEHRYEPEERAIIEKFLEAPDKDPDSNEHSRIDGDKFYYYGPIRIVSKCLSCHPRPNEQHLNPLREGQLYGVIRIQLDSKAIEENVHLNRAILISNALVTSLLVMAGSYLIVRYVIVKPVRHLKDVSDAIANGYLNVRSEIQTGDEFEDLSFTFNRMIRNLLTKQEELNSAKTILDNKVDQLAQANLALFESNKLKGDFLATMSHELRTPLHSILGFSDLLKQGDNLSDKQGRWVINIHSSGKQLLDLINDILDLARLEAGKMEVRPTEFDVGEVIEQVVATIRPLAEQKSLDLVTETAEDLRLARQDSVKLQQIISNLLSNAVKFTPEGGQIVVRAASEGDDLILIVRDNGVGIAAAEREVIFDKFRQAANPLTREHEGTGLGLSIVRELSKLLGGDVVLQSEPGRGSTFTVRIPLRLRSIKSEADMQLTAS